MFLEFFWYARLFCLAWVLFFENFFVHVGAMHPHAWIFEPFFFK